MQNIGIRNINFKVTTYDFKFRIIFDKFLWYFREIFNGGLAKRSFVPTLSQTNPNM